MSHLTYAAHADLCRIPSPGRLVFLVLVGSAGSVWSPRFQYQAISNLHLGDRLQQVLQDHRNDQIEPHRSMASTRCSRARGSCVARGALATRRGVMYTVSLSILCNICPQLRGRRGFDICHKMSHVTLAHTRVRETLSTHFD